MFFKKKKIDMSLYGPRTKKLQKKSIEKVNVGKTYILLTFDNRDTFKICVYGEAEFMFDPGCDGSYKNPDYFIHVREPYVSGGIGIKKSLKVAQESLPFYGYGPKNNYVDDPRNPIKIAIGQLINAEILTTEEDYFVDVQTYEIVDKDAIEKARKL